jgi:hypothetical protein
MIGNVVGGTLSSGFVAPFVPTSISNCYLWLDSTNTASFTYSSGAVVSQWNDLSGNNYHATQATTSKQPTRVTSPAIGVDYDGSNDVLSTNASYNGSAFTTFIIASDYTAGKVILGGGSGGDDFYFPYTQTTILYWQILSAYGTATVTYPAGLSELEIRYNGAGATNADKMKGRFAGSEQTLTFTGTMPTTISRSGQTTAIGGYNLTPILAFAGTISEVLVYNKVLDATELTNVRNYLSAKWSITA